MQHFYGTILSELNYYFPKDTACTSHYKLRMSCLVVLHYFGMLKFPMYKCLHDSDMFGLHDVIIGQRPICLQCTHLHMVEFVAGQRTLTRHVKPAEECHDERRGVQRGRGYTQGGVYIMRRDHLGHQFVH